MREKSLVIVFDSGVGGLSVFDELARKGFAAKAIYAADTAFLPYGLRSEAELKQRVPALFSVLEKRFAPQLFVMACNTASTVALNETRKAVKTPIVGTVPAIKPAASLTRTGVIGFLGTPGTVEREYSDGLIAEFAGDRSVLRFGSSRLVALAERKMAGEAVSPEAIETALAPLFALEHADRMDVAVLACTHFPLLRPEIEAASPAGLKWIDSGEAIARRAGGLLQLEEGGGALEPVAAYVTGNADAAMRPALQARGFETVEKISL
ncbi:MAG: glutamate racemase [Euryhalocaulis sp.]|uniref:glutamate racemase n=1 Tax=Euryhalocaulis sp. TaxID=2744307 RepID=UPI0017F3DCB0|nr:glutamate racemase [Euryhalocaulis sp.]MBA4802819.1 glutamate racemase [Euryhalocaulis sp.]